MKKGQEAQFNWIFILVAGMIVLGFFAVFIFKYVELQNKKASFEIVRNLDNQLGLLETASVSGTLIQLGLVSKVELNCIGNDFFAVVNGQTDLSYNLGDKIVFAPDIIKDKNMAGWINSWDYPFLVTKFMYLSGSKYKYIFVGTAPEEINKIPSDIFNIENTGTVESIKDPDNTKVVFFSDNNNANDLVKKYPTLNAVSIDVANKKVKFYKGDSVSEFDYYGEAFLFGAIFAGNAGNYECAMNNALKRLALVSKIYSRKAYLLGLSANPECRYQILDNGLKFFESYSVKNAQIGALDKNMEGLKAQNIDIIGRGCVALF